MQVHQNLKVLFFLNRKKAAKDGYAPIWVRITINSRQESFSLGVKAHPEHWDNDNKKVALKTEDARRVNSKINNTRQAIEKHFLILEAGNDLVTPQMVKSAYLNKVQVSPRKENTGLIKTLPGKIDVLLSRYREGEVERKKIKKIIDQDVKADRQKHYDIALRKLILDVTELTRESNLLFDNKDLVKTLGNINDEHILNFLGRVLAGQRAGSTLGRWRVTKTHLINFVWFRFKKIDIPLHDIAQAFAMDFYDFLTVQGDCNNNAAMKHVKNAKQLFNRAVTKGWLLRNPIERYKIKYEDPDIIPLEIEDLLKLINTDFGHKLNQIRDVFLFSCFTGYAYEDARSLTTDDLFKGVDGKKWIRTSRQKTEVPEGVPLLPIPLQIIEAYKDHPCRVVYNKIIPVFTNQYYNRLLKEIAVLAGVKIDLTTHVARHTFATTILLENDVPLSTVAKSLGQKSVRSAEKYAKATRRKLSRNMLLVEQKLFDSSGSLKNAGHL